MLAANFQQFGTPASNGNFMFGGCNIMISYILVTYSTLSAVRDSPWVNKTHPILNNRVGFDTALVVGHTEVSKIFKF